MKFKPLSFLLPALIVCVSFSFKIDYANLVFFAWNEDNTHSIQFAMDKKLNFEYAIIDKNDSSTISKKVYEGTCKITKDTLHLTYKKNVKPAGAKSYLLVEVSGNYLIQSFENTKQREFLRKGGYTFAHGKFYSSLLGY